MNRKGRTMRDPAYRGCVNLTAALAEIPPEVRLDAVAMFVSGVIQTGYYTKAGYQLPKESR